ncbi:MAG: hypothetical protein KC584_17000 [Nitrospira sp.]|nr:hypothetical protein [Nitrospira sp.]
MKILTIVGIAVALPYEGEPLKRFQKECSLYTFVGRKGSELLVELLSAGAPLVFP